MRRVSTCVAGLTLSAIGPLQRKAAGTGNLHRDADRARRRTRHRHGHTAALLGRQTDLLRRLVAKIEPTARAHRDGVFTRRTFDVIEFEMHGAAVTDQQEARQRGGEHNRIADDDIADRTADLVLAPGHRHDARGAGERRNVERHFGGAVRLHRDDTGIERKRRLRWRTAAKLGAGVAAGLDLANRALQAVDQLTVKVAQLGRQPPLAEIMVIRRRGLVVGQIENAEIDGGDDDARLLACGKPVHFDRNAQRAVRTLQLRQLQIDLETSFACRSIENHCTPIARPGIRCALASSGRRKVATT